MITGKIHKYSEDNIDTDRIIPARHCISVDPKVLSSHVLEDLDPKFAKIVNEGDILVAGENFGCGSSRENAPLAIKGSGVSAVIAKSFARIFYRNSINIGLPIIESPEAVEGVSDGDIVQIDLERGSITNTRTNGVFNSSAFPDVMQEIISAGGMIEYLRNHKA